MKSFAFGMLGALTVLSAFALGWYFANELKHPESIQVGRYQYHGPADGPASLLDTATGTRYYGSSTELKFRPLTSYRVVD